MKKIWVIINEAPNYEVSSHNHIRNLRTGRILKSWSDKDGYRQINLRVNGRTITRKVHRLVAEAFIPGNHDGLQVNHKNGRKANNWVMNLEWVTALENVLHSYRIGLRKK